MKIPELFKNKKTVFSLEIFPPKKTANIETLYKTIAKLSRIEPDFISVTYGAGGKGANTLTCDIASHIKREYGIEPLAHLTCINSDKKQVRDTLRSLENNDIENVLALRGDIDPDIKRKNDFSHANELAIEIHRISEDMQILGACYPEGHYESKDSGEDIENLKYKIGAGVKALITQLFFDNDIFYGFMDKVRAKGIDVPVSAGIMPITTSRQIERTVALSGASLPYEFTKMIGKYENDPDGLFSAGIEYASKQLRDLIEQGTQGIHIYTMNNPSVAEKIHEAIRDMI